MLSKKTMTLGEGGTDSTAKENYDRVLSEVNMKNTDISDVEYLIRQNELRSTNLSNELTKEAGENLKNHIL